MISKKCFICGKCFEVRKCRDNTAKYCSIKCGRFGKTPTKGKSFPIEKYPNHGMRNKKLSDTTKQKIALSHFGKHPSPETILKTSGKNCNFWKGGLCSNKGYVSWLKNKRNRLPKIGKHSFLEWELLKAQYNWVCPDCKKQEPKIKLSIDHIIPLSKGGSDNIENIQPLCRGCNSKKHTKIIKYEL